MTLPLPNFELIRPGTLIAALEARHAHPDSRFIAGGTDLVVNIRRGIRTPSHLIDLAGIPELSGIGESASGLRIGAGVTLAQLANDAFVQAHYPAVCQAALSIAGASHRNLATVGGNLCLDTRCIYFNQSEWWRHANGYCMKHAGTVCHVAPTGDRCHAAFSGDLAPALLALAAEVEIASPLATRRRALVDLYADDGRAHLQLKPNELVVAVYLPREIGPSLYRKVRQRAAVDFPLAGVAAALRMRAGVIDALRIGITGTNSHPLLLQGTDELRGRPVDADALKQIEKLVQHQVKPMRTTLASLNYRRLTASALARKLVAQLAAEA